MLLRNIESSKQLYALEVHRQLVQLLVIHVKNPKFIVIIKKKIKNQNNLLMKVYYDLRDLAVWHYVIQSREIKKWAKS